MDLLGKKCVPCEGGTPPMPREEAETYLREVQGWEVVEHKITDSTYRAESSKALKICKKFKFDKYLDGINFVNKVAKLAESEGHHPDLEVGYAKVMVNLWTHAVGGLSENDFILAAKIDQVLGKR